MSYCIGFAKSVNTTLKPTLIIKNSYVYSARDVLFAQKSDSLNTLYYRILVTASTSAVLIAQQSGLATVQTMDYMLAMP